MGRCIEIATTEDEGSIEVTNSPESTVGEEARNEALHEIENTRRRSKRRSRSGGTLSRRVNVSSEQEDERHAGAETERGVMVAWLSARPGKGVLYIESEGSGEAQATSGKGKGGLGGKE
jgi:hypothetical protein